MAKEKEQDIESKGESNEETEAVDEITAAEEVPLVPSICSVLFVSPKPITLEKLTKVLEVSEEEILDALDTISNIFTDEMHGFSLCEVSGGYQFRTGAAYAGVLKRLVSKKSRKLSRAASETLAVIAYKQPVQRAEIEAIRGVDALPTLKTLVDAKLIRVVGRENSVGQPALYGTTETFLEKFGLRDLSELPSIRELEEFESEPGESEDDEDHGSETAGTFLSVNGASGENSGGEENSLTEVSS